MIYKEKFDFTIREANEWHSKSLINLKNRIQNTIEKLQNPLDCNKARYLICDLNKSCGFGCQMHHVTYCLIIAAASNRTLILFNNGANWRYSNNGWNAVFKPISNCSYKNALNSVEFKTIDQIDRVVFLPIIDILDKKISHIPLSFPKQLEKELLMLHSNPPIYFLSQFLWYIMKENEQVQTHIKTVSKHIPFNKDPIVGLHIRRTDKINTEAAYHSVDEYFKWTEIWFDLLQKKKKNFSIKRKVFVATDDASVIVEIKKKYSNYEIYYVIGNANTAKLSTRYSNDSLYGIVTDVRLLSQCNYLVCTFSSQVCRLSYELMQVLQGDVANNFHSLDEIYYFGGQAEHNVIAIGDYNARNKFEIDIKENDVIGIAANHWNGFSSGFNHRTKKHGQFPSYLVIEKWRIVDFPIFN